MTIGYYFPGVVGRGTVQYSQMLAQPRAFAWHKIGVIIAMATISLMSERERAHTRGRYMRVARVLHATGFCVAIGGLLCCGGQQAAAPPAAAPAETGTANSASSAPQWAPVDTEKDCAKAQAQCGGGVCDAKVKNDCDAPVRCVLEIAVTCGSLGGASTANGSERATINPHETSDIGAQATCGGGEVLRTEIQKLSCK
jgi:hypothetical protein